MTQEKKKNPILGEGNGPGGAKNFFPPHTWGPPVLGLGSFSPHFPGGKGVPFMGYWGPFGFLEEGIIFNLWKVWCLPDRIPKEKWVFRKIFLQKILVSMFRGALKSLTVNVGYLLLAVGINSILNCENRCFQSSKTFGLLLFFVCICILFVIFVPHGESDLKSYHYQTSSCSIALVSVHTFQ